MTHSNSRRRSCPQGCTVQIAALYLAAFVSSARGAEPAPSASQLALVRLISVRARFDRPDNQGWVSATDVYLMNGGGGGRPKQSVEELASRFDQKLVDSLHRMTYSEWEIGRPGIWGWNGNFTNAHMNDVAAMPGLDHVWIQAVGLTDEGLKPLSRMPQLNLLCIGGNFTNDGLQSISELTGLTWLSIDGPNGETSMVDDGGMPHLKKLTNLERLHFSGPDITDDGLATLQDMTKLEKLSIRGSRVTGAGFAKLDKLKVLSIVELKGTPVDDRGLESFPVFPALDYLTLGKNVHGSGLKSLGKHPKLQSVDLQECDLTPSAIEHLANSNATISFLKIPEGIVPDSGLAPLRRLKNLTSITIVDVAGRYSRSGYPARQVKLAD